MIPLKLLVASVIGWGGNSDGAVLDFTASWCGPCQQMSPIVSKLERQGYPIHKVDVDANRDLVRKYHVERMPTFILVIDGVEQERITGKVTEDYLKKLCARIPRPPSDNAPAGRRSADDNASATDPVVAGHPRAAAETPAVGRTAGGQVDDHPKSRLTVPAVMTAAPAKPAPSKPGLIGALLGARKTDPAPAHDPAEGAVSRANDDARAPAAPPARGNPLAASVRIRVKDAQGEDVGSGTVIDSRIGRTIILTCGHIFRNWDKQAKIEVDYFSEEGKQTVVGRRLHHDLENDVGLIVINADSLPSCQVAAPGTRIMQGAPVITVGCSGGAKPSVQLLKITALNRYLGGDNIEVGGMPAQGRSGGGLFTKDGQVIGVCSGADSHYREGLYAGLETIQSLLDQCQLTALYRPAGAANGTSPPVTLAENVGTASERRTGAPIRTADLRNEERTLTAASAGGPQRLALEVTAGDTIDEQPIREALEQAGEAEVVCIIRPIDKPKAASRVVILNRASRRFVEYLADETDSPQDLRETTLKGIAPKAPATSATRQVQRPATGTASETMSGSRDERVVPTGPQPYRRKRTTPPLASAASR